MMKKREQEVSPAEAGKRLDKWFKDRYPELSFGKLQKMMRKGEVRLNGGRVKGPERIETGDLIRVPPISDKPVAPAGPKPVDQKLRRELQDMILYEDEHLFVLNKPPGLATQGGSGQGNRHLDAMLDGFDRIDTVRPKLVHRLDKDTSGAILIARTRQAATLLAKSFQSRTADKQYLALTMGVPDPREGEIRLKMEKVPGPHGEKMQVDDENGKPSRTLFSVADYAGKTAALVALKPLTGRTHQLRLHMATINTPIVGDRKYAGSEAYLTGSISRKLHLHSALIDVEHPKGGRVTVRAPLPDHMAASLKALGLHHDPRENFFDEEL